MSKKKSKIITTLAAAGVLLPATFSYAAQLVTGSVSEINTVSVAGVPAISLDTAGRQAILSLTINSNLLNGFDVRFDFANQGYFVLNDNGVPLTSNTPKIALSNFGLQYKSGELAMGLMPPEQTFHSTPFVWNSDYFEAGNIPLYADMPTTDATFDLMVNWQADPTRLAGIYEEQVTVTISAGDQALTTA